MRKSLEPLATKNVFLRDHRTRFDRKFEALHAKSPYYRKWVAAYGNSNFCRDVAASNDLLDMGAVNIAPKNWDKSIWE
jgi:thiaminase